MDSRKRPWLLLAEGEGKWNAPALLGGVFGPKEGEYAFPDGRTESCFEISES